MWTKGKWQDPVFWIDCSDKPEDCLGNAFTHEHKLSMNCLLEAYEGSLTHPYYVFWAPSKEYPNFPLVCSNTLKIALKKALSRRLRRRFTEAHGSEQVSIDEGKTSSSQGSTSNGEGSIGLLFAV